MHPAGPSSPSLSRQHPRLSLPATAGLALRNLARHRRRSVVNVLGVSLAVASLAFFQAFYRGSYEEMMFGAIIDYQTAHVQVQTSAFVEEDPDSYVREGSMIRSWPALRVRMESVHGVRGASARLLAPAFAGNGIRKRAILLAGVDETADRAVLRTLERLSAGRRISAAGEVLVGASLASRFGMGPGDRLRVNVRTVDDVPNIQTFTIAGLFTTGYPQIDRGLAFVGLADLQELLSTGDRVNRIYVRADSTEAAGRVRSAVAALLESRALPPGEPALTARSWTDSAAGLLEHTRGDRRFMIIFLGILLVLSVSMVSGTMYMAVFERTREIGTLRASGWQRAEVFGLFVTEAVLIGATGAALGLLLGAAVSLYLAFFPIDVRSAMASIDIPFLRLTSRFAASDALVSACAGICAAAAAGVAPALRAARIVIVKALAAR